MWMNDSVFIISLTPYINWTILNYNPNLCNFTHIVMIVAVLVFTFEIDVLTLFKSK